MKELTKEQAIKLLLKNGFGLPDACKVYRMLTNDGAYSIGKSELNSWIKKNGY